VDALTAWLQTLGLERYAQLFAASEVDLEALGLLDEGDLEKLGLPLGPRKKLIKAIAELNGTRAPAVRAQGLRVEASTELSPSAKAERRQLTVMFCDLVGSTELSTRLDPEQLRDLMQVYQRTCRDVIERYDGHVAQYLGDGLMVYFGWPLAHEDDAVRAIRAGLEITGAVSELKASTPIRARVGIHTGLVVVGETGQGDASIPKAAVGETPNIAARLQALAEPACVVVSERTSSLARGLFDYVDLGPKTLKGVPEPVQVFHIVGARAIESHFEAAHTGVGVTPLVGREEEVESLLRRWQQAKQGEGQVVLVSGEPGIGKSRLTRALRERIGTDPYIPLRYQCSPHHLNSALYPIIEQFERAAGFTRDDSPDQKLDKMEAVLAGDERQVAASAPLFAALLSLPTGRYPALNLSPQKQKEKTLEALTGQIEALARRQPVLMVFEDAHWADPTSQELLDLTLTRLQALPVLLVLTYRPEYAPAWVGQANVTTLSLNRLARRQGAELVARVTGGRVLPQEVLEQILSHTDGVPLFMEELTKSVLESKLLREEGDRYILEAPLPALAIPATLRDSLEARLDRLAPIREVAQIGACIGREFSYELLAALPFVQRAQLDEALEGLTKAELVYRRGTPPDATYTFKHALVQDAAYDSLLKSRRTQLHAQIAKVLEGDFGQKASIQPEMIAHHYTEAGERTRAIPKWLAAGRASLRRSALPEAIAQLTRGLRLTQEMPSSPERDRFELVLQATLGSAFVQAKGLGSPEAEAAFGRAQALCGAAHEPETIAPVLWGMWTAKVFRGECNQALQLAREMVSLARDHRQTLLVAHTALMDSLFWCGHLIEADAEFARAVELYDEHKDRSMLLNYSFDMRAVNLVYASHFLWMLGYPERALKCKRGLDEWVDRLQSPFLVAFANTWGAALLDYRGDSEAHFAQLRRGYEIAHSHGFRHFEVQAEVWLGWNMRGADDPTQAWKTLKNGLDGFHATGAKVPAFFDAQGALLLACTSRCAEALALVEGTISQMIQTGEAAHLAEVHRLKGEVLLLFPDDRRAEAEQAFERALEVSRAQQAKSWELRAATSLASLLQLQGKRSEARELLAPVYHWFTEGLDTKDLKQAKALLESLS
jgi:class 3 adenylate cyclase/predicted ATPase